PHVRGRVDLPGLHLHRRHRNRGGERSGLGRGTSGIPGDREPGWEPHGRALSNDTLAGRGDGRGAELASGSDAAGRRGPYLRRCGEGALPVRVRPPDRVRGRPTAVRCLVPGPTEDVGAPVKPPPAWRPCFSGGGAREARRRTWCLARPTW